MKHWMKKLIATSAVLLSVGSAAFLPVTASAEEKAAAPAAVTAPAAASTAAPAAPAAAPAPVPNKGDTAWLLISTALVIMMTVPALGLFYGGLVRSKNCLLYTSDAADD